MKLRFSLLSLCVLLAGPAVRPAAAANEAWYFPDGMLYVPHVNLQDNNGDTVTNYAAFFKKSSADWNFKLYGLAPVATNSGSTNFAIVTNYVTVTNYAATTNVVVTTNAGTVTTNYVVVTNYPAVPTANVAGTWDFTFNESFRYSYNGSKFVGTTNSPLPFPETITLTLAQTGSDVEGTGTVSSVQLSGEVTNDFFACTLLAGSAPSAINLVDVRALVGDDAMTGDYSWSSAGTSVIIGEFTATKH